MSKRALLVALLLAVAPAAAHVNATTVAPEGTVDPIMGANATVTLFANCAVVIAEYDGDAAGARTPLTLLLAEPPSWLNFTGDDVPFTMSDPSNCDQGVDPDNACPCVFTTGNILLVPGPMAPAFETFTLQPDAVNRHGADENVQGGAFEMTVGYYANITQLDEGHIDLNDGDEYTLRLEVFTNGATTLALDVDAPSGYELRGLPATVAIESPLLDGNASRVIEIEFSIHASDDHHDDSESMGDAMDAMGNDTMDGMDGNESMSHMDHDDGFMLDFTLTPIFNGTESATGTIGMASLHVVPMEHDHEAEPPAEAKDSPLPIVAALLALFIAARRR